MPGNPPDPRARSPFVEEASKRGIFAYITGAEVGEWQSAIDIVLRRFAEYHDLEGAFGRRAVTERAKGIVMERHSVDDADACEMLRDQSPRANTKLADVAATVVQGHRRLPKQPDVSQTARTDEVLSRFETGGTGLVLLWWRFAMTAVLFAPL